MSRPFVVFATAIVVLSLTACANTPLRRIQRDPGTFAQLSPEQQAQVQQGRITVGMKPDAVRLALGQPDRILERANAQGMTEVWQYLDVLYAPVGPCFGAFYRFNYPIWCTPFPEPVATREVLRVAFKDGVVESYERER